MEKFTFLNPYYLLPFLNHQQVGGRLGEGLVQYSFGAKQWEFGDL